MAFKEVASLDADTVISLGGSNKKTGKKNPTSIEGYYLGSRKVETKKGKNGTSTIHFFQTSKGNVGVWGKTDSDRKLANASPGAMTRITFVGMQSTPNGDMYKYKVEVDADNTIDVEGLAAAESEDNSNTSDESYGDNDGEPYEESTEEYASEEDEATQLAAVKAQQERAARVTSLLSKGKKV